MADIEGVGAVLEVKKDILEGLKMAQFRIDQLSLSSEKLATNFSRVTSGMSKITGALTNKKFEIQFTDNGATASVTDLTRAAEMMAKTVPAAISKAESSEKQLAREEQTISNQVEAILRRKSASYNDIIRRMAEMAEQTRRLKDLEAKASAKGISFSVNPELVARMAAATGDLRTKLEALDTVGRKNVAMKSFSDAMQMSVKSADDARVKIELIKKALADLKDAERSGFSTEEVSRLSRELNNVLAETKQLVPALKKADKKAAKAAKDAAKAQKDFDKAFSKANDNLSFASGMGEKGPQEVVAKLKAMTKGVEECKRVAGKGIVPANWTRDAEASITRLRTKLAAMNATMGVCNRSARFLSDTLRYMFPTMMMYRVVKDLVSIRSEFEMAEKSLGIILKDANTASDIFREIQNIAVKSPFQVKDLVKQTKQLAAYRIETDKLVDTTKMLGDISAGVGVDMNRLILAYGQVKAATVLKGTELRQFSEAGVNMLGGLAKRFSDLNGRIVTTGEVLSMITKKMVSFEDVEAVLRAETAAGGTFYRMQEKQAETLAGQISNLRDRLDIAFNEIGKSSQGIMNSVVKVFTWLISNYKLLTSVVGGFIVFKTMTGLVVNFNTALWPALKNLGDFFALAKSSGGIVATISGLGAWAPAIGALSVAFVGLISVYRAFTKEQRELNKAVKDSQKDARTMEADYRTLLGTIQNNNLSIGERTKALEELKGQFGNILPLQDATIEKITSEKNAYYDLISAIREYNNEQARMAVQRKSANNILEKEEERSNKLYGQMMQMASNNQLGKNRNVAKAITERMTPQIMRQLYQDIQNEIIDGTINAEQATEKYYESLAGWLSVPAEAVKKFYTSMEADEQRVTHLFSQVEDSVKKANNTIKKYDLGESFSAGFDNQVLLRDINNVKKRLEEVRARFLSENGGNTVKVNALVNEYLSERYNSLANAVKAVKDDRQRAALTKALEKSFEGILADPVEKKVAEKWAELADKFPSIVSSKAIDALQWKTGQDTPDTYIKRLNTELSNYQDTCAAIKENKPGAMLMDPALKKEAQDMVPVLQTIIKFVTGFDLTISAAEKRAQAQAYKSNLKQFITTVKGAAKELDTLDDATKSLFRDKLAIMGKELGVEVPDFLNEDSLDKWLESLKGKLTKKEMLEIKIAWNKDKLADQMRELGETASDLWDKLDTAKTFSQYGINMPGFNVEGILSQLHQIENKYLNMHTEAGDKAAKDLADRRLKIVMDEQKEAAKIIYESQKKVLDQVDQAYQDMYERIGKIRKIEGPEADAGVAATITRGLEDAAKAQWDLYQKTEMYTAAFGNLEGLSEEVLRSLRTGLQATLDAGDLSATDIKSIKKALSDIDSQMGVSSIKGFFATIKDGFATIDKVKAGEDMRMQLQDLYLVSQKGAQDAYEEWLNLSNFAKQNPTEENLIYAQQAYERYKKALQACDEAMRNLTEAQRTALNDIEKSKAKIDAMGAAYASIGSNIEAVFGLVENVVETFGGELSSEMSAAMSGLKDGFGIVGTAITAASAAISLYSFVTDEATKDTIAAKAVMKSYIPLLAVGASLAAIAAIVKARDASLQKQVESHKKAVEDLEKAYDKLDKAFDKTLTLYSSMSTYNSMTSNLQKQRQEIEEAISLDRRRKQTDAVKDEIKDLENQLAELDEKFVEANEKKMDLLGANSDYQSLASDWAEAWLDAFKETGNGLSGLQDSFQDFVDKIIVGQLSTRVVGQFMEQQVQPLVDSILADWVVTKDEMASLKAIDLSSLNNALAAIYEAYGIAAGSGSESDSTLQKGIQSVTETTAQALEALLNSVRFYVADNNAILARLESLFNGTGDIPNPMLNELKLQTAHLKALSGAVTPNGKALNVVVKSI